MTTHRTLDELTDSEFTRVINLLRQNENYYHKNREIGLRKHELQRSIRNPSAPTLGDKLALFQIQRLDMDSEENMVVIEHNTEQMEKIMMPPEPVAVPEVAPVAAQKPKRKYVKRKVAVV